MCCKHGENSKNHIHMNSFISVSTYIGDEKFLEAINYMGLKLIHVSNVARVYTR